MENDFCCVCYNKNSTLLSCKHNICNKCIKKLSKPSCPYCRKDLISELNDDIINIINKNKIKEDKSKNIEEYLYLYFKNLGLNDQINYFIYEFKNILEILELNDINQNLLISYKNLITKYCKKKKLKNKDGKIKFFIDKQDYIKKKALFINNIYDETYSELYVINNIEL